MFEVSFGIVAYILSLQIIHAAVAPSPIDHQHTFVAFNCEHSDGECSNAYEGRLATLDFSSVQNPHEEVGVRIYTEQALSQELRVKSVKFLLQDNPQSSVEARALPAPLIDNGRTYLAAYVKPAAFENAVSYHLLVQIDKADGNPLYFGRTTAFQLSDARVEATGVQTPPPSSYDRSFVHPYSDSKAQVEEDEGSGCGRTRSKANGLALFMAIYLLCLCSLRQFRKAFSKA